MTLTTSEIEFLAAWAREEWEPACYQLPAHRLQLEHGVPGMSLIKFIKAWTESEHRKDADILSAASNPQPLWPWPDNITFQSRLADLQRREREPAA
jgi:hypothetical protein